MQHRKIPVFYHIPKNAGTYVSDWLMIAFRHYRAHYTDWLKNYVSTRSTIKSLQIIKNGFMVARVLVGDPNYFLNECSFITSKHSKTEFDIRFEDFSADILQNVFLFGIIIESQGFCTRQEILKFVSNFNLHHFLILRDPFSRAQSIYNYNVSKESIHDYFHGNIESKNFEEYIMSSKLEDSWLIRNLLDLKDSETVEEHHYNETVSLLKEFGVYDIKETNKAIYDAIETCYGVNINQIKMAPWDIFHKNETNIKKILPKDLSLEALETFKRRTFFDQKLYDLYVRFR